MIETPQLDWWAIAPELATGIGALVALLVGMGRGEKSRIATIVVAAFSLIAAFVITLATFQITRLGAFSGQIDSDELANAGRLIINGAGLVALTMAVRGRSKDGRHGEFHALLLTAVMGMGLFVSAGTFVTLFVGLELFSISLYVLCALDAERITALESGLKYLIISGLSSAILLYGSALVFGATGTLDIAAVGAFEGTRGLLLNLGEAMVLGGIVFKASAAPVHWWTVDVYEGAATPVTAFMSVATKAAALIALVRVLTTGFAQEANLWVPVIAGLAVASITIGNLGAISQSALKRMLGFSSIAQAGYLLLGIVGWRDGGISALIYGLFVYAAMQLGAFAYVMVVERDLGRDATFADLSGRGWVSGDGFVRALPALGMAVCAFSLAGIPPMGGFFSKVVLFSAAIHANYAWLAVVAALGSVVGLAYYLRIVVELYVRDHDTERVELAAADVPDNGEGPWWPAKTPIRAAATLAVIGALAVLFMALVPKPFTNLGCDAELQMIKPNATSPCSTAVPVSTSDNSNIQVIT